MAEKYGDQPTVIKIGEIEKSLTLREYYINTLLNNVSISNLHSGNAQQIYSERIVGFVDEILKTMKE